MRLKTVSVLALSGLMCMGGVVIANVKKNNCKDTACYCKWVIKQCVSKCKYYYKHKRGGYWESCTAGKPACNKRCTDFCGEVTEKDSCNDKSYPNK